MEEGEEDVGEGEGEAGLSAEPRPRSLPRAGPSAGCAGRVAAPSLGVGMEGSGVGIGRIDCYEDMFKEITRKLYGEDPDHRSKKRPTKNNN